MERTAIALLHFFIFVLSCSVISLAPAALCQWSENYGLPLLHTDHHTTYQTPLATMVDVTNDLATLVLQDYAHAKGNFAFSPYGAASVLVVLYEGARGETARQIHRALRLPWNRDVTRVGFRDIHRNLVSYFTHEGYLSGMTLSKNHTALREDYKRILRFYGYDVDLVQRPDMPVPGTTTRAMSDVPPSIGPVVMMKENVTGTTPMVEEEKTNSTTSVVREETSPGTTSMVMEETSARTTSMVREENMAATTPMVKVENTTDAPSVVREENVTGAPSVVREENINGTTSRVADETMAVTTSMVREETSKGSTLMVRGEKISTITVPSTTEVQSVFTVFFPTTPEPDNSTSEKDKNNDAKRSNLTGTIIDMRKPSTTTAPGATSEDELEDITTTVASVVEHPTTVEETKDPTIYPSEILDDENEEDDDTKNATTEITWNLFKDIIPEKSEENKSRTGVSSTLGPGATTPRPKTEQAVEELPTTLPTPLVSSSTEESKEITYAGKAAILVAKSPSSGETSSETPAETATKEIKSLPVSEPPPPPPPPSSSTTEATPSEDLTTKNPDKNSTLKDEVKPETSTVSNGDTSDAETPKSRRSVRSIRRGSYYPDMALELDNSMYDSHVKQGSELYAQLPRYTFLVDGVNKEDVPVMPYTSVFPFAYVSELDALALELPLDDSRYKLLILLPTRPRGLPHLIREMKNYPLRRVYEALEPTRVNAIIPSFMVEGFVILTPALQQLGIWDVFDPRRCDLSGMSADPELYVRNVEQSITVVIRNYMEILDIHTRTLAARMYAQRVYVTHPFLYFVLDSETHVALMAGKMVDPLSSRIY